MILKKKIKKILLNKLYFSALSHSNVHKKMIENVLNYCFGESTENFIQSSVRDRLHQILDQISTGSLPVGLRDLINNFIVNKKFKDTDLLQLFYLLLKNIKIDDNSKILNENLHYILIIFCNLISLRDIFIKHFTRKNELLIEEIKINENKGKDKIHPDTALVFKSTNAPHYIGASQLCCVCCAFFLKSCGCDFRGVSKKFELNWLLPDQNETYIYTDFAKQMTEFTIQISNENRPHSIHFEKIQDKCQKTSDKISDDLCLFLKYYKNKSSLDDLEFNCILNDFKNNNLNNFIEFLEILRKKFHCKCNDNC